MIGNMRRLAVCAALFRPARFGVGRKSGSAFRHGPGDPSQPDITLIREKIADGVRSLREGRVTDGETFMARMDAELEDIERHGRV